MGIIVLLNVSSVLIKLRQITKDVPLEARTKPKETSLLKLVPTTKTCQVRPALVENATSVPPCQMESCRAYVLVCRGVLSLEELFIVVQPTSWVFATVITRKLQSNDFWGNGGNSRGRANLSVNIPELVVWRCVAVRGVRSLFPNYELSKHLAK